MGDPRQDLSVGSAAVLLSVLLAVVVAAAGGFVAYSFAGVVLGAVLSQADHDS